MADTHKRGGLEVEYALSARASCKGCSGAIKKDSMRVGKEIRSEYHDGWDKSWFHFKCAKYDFKKISELRNWELLRWEDQLKIKEITGEKQEKTDEEKRREKENKEVWELKDQVNGEVPTKDLTAMLEANGMAVEKVTPARVIHKVADGMLYGVVGPCPECKTVGSLRYTGFDFVCKTGWLSAFTRCEFKGTKGVQRYKWKIPTDLKKKHDFLGNWKPPKDHPTETFKENKGDAKGEGETKDPQTGE